VIHRLGMLIPNANIATEIDMNRVLPKNYQVHFARLKVGSVDEKGWREHDAEHGVTGVDQGDVDGELTVAVDEFFGAIEWIDEPEAGGAGVNVRDATGGDRLFGHHRSARVEAREPLEDDGLGPLIGEGDRRLVRLGVHRKIPLVNEADHRAGLEGNVFDVLEQGAGDRHGADYSLRTLD